MAKETPKALAAFERYWALGPMRSLRKLAEDDLAAGLTESILETYHQRLKEWSTEHAWQDRVKQRVIEEAELARAQNRERADKHRQKLLAAIEVDCNRLLKRLQESPGELLADDAAALEKLTKLYYQLAEQPLADRHELTGKDGGPIQGDVNINPSPDNTAAVLAILLECGGIEPPTDASSDAEDDGVHTADSDT